MASNPFCESCECRKDDFRHLKACVEPKNWPTGPYPSTDGRLNRLRAASKPAGAVYGADAVLTSHSSIYEDSGPLQSVMTLECGCGYMTPAASRNPSGAMRLHKANSKAHKAWEAVTSG
jgi:hypothetical protein